MKTSALPSSAFAQILRHLVGFSRRETRGFVVLLGLLATLVLLPTLVGRWLVSSPAPAVSTEDVRTLDRLAADLERTGQVQRRARFDQPAFAADRSGRTRRWGQGSATARPVTPLAHLTPFNPNTLSAFDWQRRGVPADVARRLVSYGRKAGGYRYREQLERIHGFDERLSARLLPLVQLPTRQELFGHKEAAPTTDNRPATTAEAPPAADPTALRPGFVRKPRVVQAFDLNTADTLTLMQLRGIGRKRAARIVELREKLGGFVSPTQLAEVWGLDAPLVDSLTKYGHVAADFQPRLLAINSASLDELRAHPYVGYRLARVLAAYREQHGPFAKAEDLLQIKILDEATYQKLLPYVALR